MLYDLSVDQGILPSREGIWGFRGTARYGKSGGDTALNYYVDGNHANASDSNDGTDPEAPFATIQAAITASNALIDWALSPPYEGFNTIWVSPGVYAENLTPAYYCRIVGLGLATGGDICVNVEPAAGSPLAGTGLALHLYNIRFTANTAVPVLDFGVMNSCIIDSCMIVDGNPGLATVGIDTTDAGGSKIINCNITHTASTMPIGIRSTGDFYDCLIQGCLIKAATTGIDLSGAALCGGSVAFRNMIWGGGSVLTATGIDDSVVGDLLCAGNWITATDAISHLDPAMTIDNHVINAGAGAIELVGT
jgi:hypothetical protein